MEKIKNTPKNFLGALVLISLLHKNANITPMAG